MFFYQGLNEEIKDELATRDAPTSLAEMESLSSRIDQRLQERRAERSQVSQVPRSGPRIRSQVNPMASSPGSRSPPSMDPVEPMQIGRTRLSPQERE